MVSRIVHASRVLFRVYVFRCVLSAIGVSDVYFGYTRNHKQTTIYLEQICVCCIVCVECATSLIRSKGQ